MIVVHCDAYWVIFSQRSRWFYFGDVSVLLCFVGTFSGLIHRLIFYEFVCVLSNLVSGFDEASVGMCFSYDAVHLVLDSNVTSCSRVTWYAAIVA